jgi:hypothetical protein
LTDGARIEVRTRLGIAPHHGLEGHLRDDIEVALLGLVADQVALGRLFEAFHPRRQGVHDMRHEELLG